MIIDRLARGTRIIGGQEAKNRRVLLNQLIHYAEDARFNEIILPSVERADIYTDKAGAEILGQIYAFPDKKPDNPTMLCLRPEATATIQLIADKHYKHQKDVKLWYFEKCWRYERCQAGRYREFWQFGCEWINPRYPDEANTELKWLAERMVSLKTKSYITTCNVQRGLDYYIAPGWEISVDSLGAQKQVCGAGQYKQGIGFAIGFDRLMLCSSPDAI